MSRAARLIGRNAAPAWIGLIKRTDCSHSDRYAKYENAASGKMNAATMTALNAARRSSARSISGWLLRASIATNTPSASAAPTRVTSVWGEPQPTSDARVKPYVAAPAETLNATIPGKSMRLARRGSSRDRAYTANAIATTEIGRLTKKIQRHERLSVSNPPRIGPAAAAAPLIAPQTPNASPRSRPS